MIGNFCPLALKPAVVYDILIASVRSSPVRREGGLMEFAMARAITFSAILILVAVLLVGCNMDFLSDSDDEASGPACPTYAVWEDRNDDGIDDKLVYDCNDELQYWEEYRSDDADRTIAVRRHLPNDDVQWTRLYDYDGDDQTLHAFYLPVSGGNSHELEWYVRSAYQDGNLVRKAEFEVSTSGPDALQWLEVREYSGDGNETYRGRFDGDVDAEWVHAYQYTEFDGEDRLSVDERFEPAESGAASTAALGGGGLRALATGDTYAFGLSLPSSLEPIPSLSKSLSATADTLDLAWTTRYWYREGGKYSVKYDPQPKPLLVTISDENLDEDLEISVDYNTRDLPTSKVTSYGGEEAMRLDFGYTDADLLDELAVSGPAVLNLEFAVTYNEEDVPSEVQVTQDGEPFQRFEYSYQSGGTAGEETETDSYLDPIDFGGRVDTITWYEGDGSTDEEKLGTYSFTYTDATAEAPAQVRIDAAEYDGDTDSETNAGYFLLTKNDAGRTVAFESYDADGDEVWSYEYAYDDAGNRVTEEKYDASGNLTVPAGFDMELLFE